MERRQIKLKDGRYLIFYTFTENSPTASSKSDEKKPEPKADQVAEEEENV
jgi:hypothetical protein